MKNTLHHVVVGGLFLTLLVPFVVFESLFFPFITGKAFVFRILVELTFAAWLVLSLMDISYRPKRSWLLYAFAIFMAAITLADLFGVNVYRSFWSNFERMDGLVTFLHLFAYFLMLATVFKTEKAWSKFLNGTLIANTVLCLFYGLPQIFGNAQIHQSADRIDATLGNAAYLAVYLLMHVFIALFLFLRTRSTSLKWVYAISVVLQIFVMYKTQTRGPLLGLVGGLLLSTLIIAIFERERKNIRRISVGVLVFVVLCIGGFFLTKNSDFIKNSPTLHRFSEISFSENFLKGQGRYYIWPMAIEGFKEHPILGWGQDNFIYVFNKYYDPAMHGQEQWFDRSHNIVLDWLIAGGLVGLAAYLFILVTLLYYIWRGKGELGGAEFSIADKGVLTGLLAAYFFQNMFVFDNLTSYMLFVTVLAYVYSMRTSPSALPVLPRLIVSKDVSQKVVVSVAVLAVVFVVYAGNIRQIRAATALYQAVAPEANGQFDYAKDTDSFLEAISYGTFGSEEAREHLLLMAQKINTADQSEQTRVKAFEAASAQMKQQIDQNQSPNARNYLFMGLLLSRYGQYDQALVYLNGAHNLSPRKQSIYFEIANAYSGQGKIAEALGFAKEAFDLAPEYMQARILYFTLALKSGNASLAQELLDGVDEQTFFFDDRVLTAFIDQKQYTNALAILKKRAETDPNNPQTILSLAAGYLMAGDRQSSISAIERFIALDPAKNKAQGEYYIKEIRAGRNP